MSMLRRKDGPQYGQEGARQDGRKTRRDDHEERPGHVMDTRPDDAGVIQPRIGAVGMLRWGWRQLTSMRTALFLLLLLAIGAVPGSIWPQRGIDAARVTDYLVAHPTLGPWLDQIGFFDVYASPWFAAIYLLLFISLVGCITPRSRLHWRAMRAQPPRAPRRLERLPAHREQVMSGTPADVEAAAREVLRHKRYRVRAAEDGDTTGRDAGAVSAESGYLRETGNLIFHISLVVIIIAVAMGHLWGWRGDVIVPEGQAFSNAVPSYDTIDPGPWVSSESMKPFSVRVDKLDVSFEDQAGGAQRGAPRDFTAFTTTHDRPGGHAKEQILKVNSPLSVGGASVSLLGNGYAPVVTVRDAQGRIVYGPQATPFLPQDNNYRSVGAIKVPGGDPQQLGFFGFFVPTLEVDPVQGAMSVFPDLHNPALVLGLYQGDLFPGGRPQSVYTLDTDKMTQVKAADGQPLRLLVRPGQTVQLPEGLGSVTLDKVVRFAGISVRHDPGKLFALWGSLFALAGLVASLTIRRRRVFVRLQPAPVGTGAGPGGSDEPGGRDALEERTLVTIGGLAKGDDPRLGEAMDDVLRALAERMDTTT